MADSTDIEFRLEFKKDCLPLAIDCGGSVIKLVFANEVHDKQNSNDKKLYHLEVKSFPREELDLVVDFIKEQYVHVMGTEGLETEMFATGSGSNEYSEQLKTSLNINLKVLDEFTVSVKTFRFLVANMSKKELLHVIAPEVQDAIDTAFVACKVSHDAWSKNGEVALPLHSYNVEEKFWKRPMENFPDDVAYAEAVGKSMFPCLLVTLGTALTTILVQKEGQSKVVGFSPRCGRMFLSLGQLMTGEKSFDKLLEMATTGDSAELDITAYDIAVAGAESASDDCAYNEGLRHMKSTVIYAYGKVSKLKNEDIKKEDIMSCVLRNLLEDIAMEVGHTAREYDISRVFFIGGFTNSKFTREKLAHTIGVYNTITPEDKCRYEFLRHGGHLGAMGALLTGCIDDEEVLCERL